MSAFVVSKDHIDYLVQAARLAPARTCQGIVMKLDGWHVDTHGDEVGRALWQENLNSVLYRYPAEREAGQYFREHYGPEVMAAYRCPVFPAKRFDPVAALKAVRCYEYQSCEHPEWNGSPAKAFCEDLREWLIAALPGYDEAPWEIHEDTRIAA